jgi:hypothetical protein
MPLPPVKQRIWQALRLQPSTLNQLSLVVEAPAGTIYNHINKWHRQNLLTAIKLVDRTKPGPATFCYSLVDRTAINPPISNSRTISKFRKSQEIWAALERKPSTLEELCFECTRSNAYKILRGWCDKGVVVATPSPDEGDRKPKLVYSIVDSVP